jgi:hypothetical protein
MTVSYFSSLNSFSKTYLPFLKLFMDAAIFLTTI